MSPESSFAIAGATGICLTIILYFMVKDQNS